MNKYMKKPETKYPATCTVYWPTGPVNCCDKHARALVGLSTMLGSHVGVTKLEDVAECSNCKNESVVASSR